MRTNFQNRQYLSLVIIVFYRKLVRVIKQRNIRHLKGLATRTLETHMKSSIRTRKFEDIQPESSSLGVHNEDNG